MKAVYKLARRTIRSFRGRYLALLLIVTLSVGFFSGLKITKDAMANTCQQYLDEQRLYDYRLISTAGFPQQAVEQFAQLSFVETAEGSYSLTPWPSGRGSAPAPPCPVFAGGGLAPLSDRRAPARGGRRVPGRFRGV